MAKKRYTLTSDEGVDLHARETGERLEVGNQVELDVSHDAEKAIVAAGWVELVEEKTPKKKEG